MTDGTRVSDHVSGSRRLSRPVRGKRQIGGRWDGSGPFRGTGQNQRRASVGEVQILTAEFQFYWHLMQMNVTFPSEAGSY